MSFAFLPLYTGDYRRDTQHLTPLRHGVFLLLLMHCWDTRGPLPIDEQEMAGIANCRSADEVEALRYVLRRFFVCMEDGHYNKRMQREVERAENISGVRSIAGRRGYQARAKQLLDTCLATASTPTPTLTITPTPTPTIKDQRHLVAASGSPLPTKPVLQKQPPKIGTRLPENWQLPDEWKDWALAVRQDWTPQGVVRESLTFRDFWTAKSGKDATKVNWLATWRLWIRRADHEPVR